MCHRTSIIQPDLKLIFCLMLENSGNRRDTVISVIIAPGLCIFLKTGPLLEEHAEV